MTNVAGQDRTWSFTYHDDGDTNTITEDGTPATRSYNGDLVTGDTGGLSASWDQNGQLAARNDVAFTWNGQGRLQSASLDEDNHIALTYDLEGNRIAKCSTQSAPTTHRQDILDVSGRLSASLLDIDAKTAFH